MPQLPKSARNIYDSEAVFRETIDRCDSVLRRFVPGSIAEFLIAECHPKCPADSNAEILHVASIAAYQLAMFELWRSKGLRHDGVLSLSLGDWLSLYSAGALSLEATMTVVCAGMKMVTASFAPCMTMIIKDTADSLDRLSCTSNGKLRNGGEISPGFSYAFCLVEDQNEIFSLMTRLGISYFPTRVNFVYHSPLVFHDREAFQRDLEGIFFERLRCNLYSSLQGKMLPAGTVVGFEECYEMPRRPLRFGKAVQASSAEVDITYFVLGEFEFLSEVLKDSIAPLGMKAHLVDAVSAGADGLPRLDLTEKTLRTMGITIGVSDDNRLFELSEQFPLSSMEAPAIIYRYSDPYSFYEKLLTKEGAVFSPSENTWLLARYADVSSSLKDPRLSKQTGNPTPCPIDFSMLFRDASDHSRLRGMISPAFSSRSISGMEQSIRGIVEQLIAKVENHRQFDFISELATPLPVGVIAKLLSVPEEDWDQLGKWSAATIPMTGQDGAPLPEGQKLLGEALDGLKSYFTNHFKRGIQNACPHLAQLSPGFREGPDFSDDELVGTAVLMLIAGHETTVNLIGNGLLCLLRNPEQMEKLRGNPGLIDGAIEEMLRFESPVARGTFRVTTDDVEFSGTVIPRGSFVAPLIGAANRDPQVFTNPNEFNVERRENKHLAFGNGSHYCLGAQLARLEARVIFKYLLERFGQIELADPLAIDKPDRLDWIQSTAVRGLHSLNVFFQE